MKRAAALKSGRPAKSKERGAVFIGIHARVCGAGACAKESAARWRMEGLRRGPNPQAQSKCTRAGSAGVGRRRGDAPPAPVASGHTIYLSPSKRVQHFMGRGALHSSSTRKGQLSLQFGMGGGHGVHFSSAPAPPGPPSAPAAALGGSAQGRGARVNGTRQRNFLCSFLLARRLWYRSGQPKSAS